MLGFTAGTCGAISGTTASTNATMRSLGSEPADRPAGRRSGRGSIPTQAGAAPAATADSPEAWNQGVDKSVDAVQARYIERMDSTGVDEAFVRGFLDDVIAEIVKDREAGRFQYGRMDPRDVQSHLDMFKRLKDPEAVSAIASGQPLPAKFLD